MTLTATFEELNGNKLGIIRIYPNEDTIEPAHYLFCLTVVIKGNTATLKGAYNIGISFNFLKYVGELLYKHRVNKLTYTHNLKVTTLQIKMVNGKVRLIHLST
jgi:hypothetical protein